MVHHDLTILLDAMASPDPDVRDGWAYAELHEGIASGRFAEDHDVIRASMVAHLTHPQVQARAFAPLVLMWLIDAGDRNRGAFDAVADWYGVERDTRGFDDDLGWLHAVAHGADHLAAAARRGVAEAGEVLDVLARRMVVDAPQWADQEDARVASALVAALAQVPDSAESDDATRWLRIVDEACDAFESACREGATPGRPPMWLRNVTSTLALLHVALCEVPLVAGEGVDVAHLAAVRTSIAARLARIVPWLVRPRG